MALRLGLLRGIAREEVALLDGIYIHPTLMVGMEVAHIFDTDWEYLTDTCQWCHDVSGNNVQDVIKHQTSCELVTPKFGIHAGGFGVSPNRKLQTDWAGVSGNGARSHAIWYKGTFDDGGIFGWGDYDGGSGERWYAFLNANGAAGNIGAVRVSVGGGYITGTTNVNDDSWHLIIIRFTGTNITDAEILVDDQLEVITGSSAQAVNTVTGGVASKHYLVGAYAYPGPGYGRMRGSLTYIITWSKYLSDDEISDLWNGGNGLDFFPAVVTDPVQQYWQFDGTQDRLQLENVDGGVDMEITSVGDFSMAMLLEFPVVPHTGGDFPEGAGPWVLTRQGGHPVTTSIRGWRLQVAGGTVIQSLRFQVRYRFGGADTAFEADLSSLYIPVNTKILFGASFDVWTGSQQEINFYFISSVNGTTHKLGTTNQQAEHYSNADPFFIGGDDGGYDSKVKIYWENFKGGVLWTQADYEEMYAHSFKESWGKNPLWDNPRFYIKMARPVAATYEAEVGTGPGAPYILDVYGNPVKGGI